MNLRPLQPLRLRVALGLWDLAQHCAHVFQEELLLEGGGFAGRCVPEEDTTRTELAAGHNHDNEGRNGGWCLTLHRADERVANVFGLKVAGPFTRDVTFPHQSTERGQGERKSAAEATAPTARYFTDGPLRSAAPCSEFFVHGVPHR